MHGVMQISQRLKTILYVDTTLRVRCRQIAQKDRGNKPIFVPYSTRFIASHSPVFRPIFSYFANQSMLQLVLDKIILLFFFEKGFVVFEN